MYAMGVRKAGGRFEQAGCAGKKEKFKQVRSAGRFRDV
jgi:hypothetical protein